MSRARLQFLLRGLFSAGLIALLLSRLHWAELAGLLRGVHPAPLLGGALLSLACILLMAVRTGLMLRQWRIALGFRTLCALTWLGQFCNAFLPGSTGGDAVKLFRVCRLVPDEKPAAFAALVADRLVALAALILLAGAALVLGDRGGVLAAFAQTGAWHAPGYFWPGAGALAVAMGIFLFLLGRAERFAGARAKGRQLLAQMRTGLRPGPLLIQALALAVAVHLASMAGYFLFARALQVPVAFGQVMLFWPVVMVATLLPLSVNGYGLRECVLLYYFQRWHLISTLRPDAGAQATVIALSLLIVVNDFLWSLPGGFCLAAGPDAGPVTPERAAPKIGPGIAAGHRHARPDAG